MKKDGFNINNTESFDSVEKRKEKIYYVPLSALLDNEKNKINEKYDTKEDHEALCNSILAYGLKSPLSVTKTNDNYLIQSGHRRKKALQELFNKGEKVYYNSIEVTSESIPVLITKEYKNDFEQFMSLQAFNMHRTTNKERDKEIAKELTEMLNKFEESGYKFEGRKRDIVAKLMEVSSKTVDRMVHDNRKNNNKQSFGEKLIKKVKGISKDLQRQNLNINKEEIKALKKELNEIIRILGAIKPVGQMTREGE